MYVKNKFVFFYAIFFLAFVILGIVLLEKWDKNVNIYDEVEKANIKNSELESNNLEDIDNKTIGLGEYTTNLPLKTIKVKDSDTGEILEMSINDYLISVVPSEMPPDYDIEALKAQAIVARTYAYEKMLRGAHTDCDICSSASHCQAYYDTAVIDAAWKRKGYDDNLRAEYWEKIKTAVESTENIIVTYNGEIIKAYFHAASGGKTENVSAIWGRQNIPYLVSVESLGEEDYKYYKTEVVLTVADMEQKLNSSTSQTCSIKDLKDEIIKVVSYTDSGRVDKVDIGGNIYTANELRSALRFKIYKFYSYIFGWLCYI